MKKTFLFVLTAMVVCMFTGCKQSSSDEPTEQNIYVDLGLPSGTLWKNQNEVNPNHKFGLFTFNQAIDMYGQQLPTREQWQELLDKCTWSWTYEGFKVVGNNKNYIIIPAEGAMDDMDKEPYGIGEDGNYWTSAPSGTRDAWAFEFEAGGKDIGIDNNLSQETYISVRLVQNVK